MTVEEIKQLFIKKGQTLGSVESFTGGLFASTITAVSGASNYYKGAVVTYATEEKVNILKIDQSLVDKYGVVSKEIAQAMAINGRKVLNVDYCVSFTGNAGPSVMENKPVGEVYVGICSNIEVRVFCLNLKGDRHSIQKQAVEIALEQLSILLNTEK